MNKFFTLKDITLFTQSENQIREEIFQEEIESPKNSTINNLLAFSKALSVKK